MTQKSDKALEPADKIRALKLAVAPDDPQAARYLNEMIDDVLREVAEEAKREEREALRAKLEQHRLAGLTPYLLSWLDAREGKP